MGSPSPQSDSSVYLESLMRAGQAATKQFGDALTAAMGVIGKPANGRERSPVAVTANLQQLYWSPILDFWRGFINGKPAANAESPAQGPRGDRRFKDEAWSHSPYYDLLKQSYLLNSKQLTDFVDQAQVDDRSNCSFVSMPVNSSMR